MKVIPLIFSITSGAHTHACSRSDTQATGITRHTLAQLRTNKSPFIKSYLHKVAAKSPLCTLCNTHTTHIISSTAPTYAPPLSPLDLWTDPAGVTALLARWMEKLAGGPQAGRSDSLQYQGSWEWVDKTHTTSTRQKTHYPSHPLHKYKKYFNTSRLKHYHQQRPLHNNHPNRPHSH